MSNPKIDTKVYELAKEIFAVMQNAIEIHKRKLGLGFIDMGPFEQQSEVFKHAYIGLAFWHLAKKQEPAQPAQSKERICLSWRIEGDHWTLTEDSKGETLSLRNSIRETELTDLTDGALQSILAIVTAALSHRNQPTTTTTH